ncbi:MAG TPA: hypothetical protein VFY83_04485 [Anaerolineales bacterium]|nr:hypothetical protein [Anaerolineales bacterium]
MIKHHFRYTENRELIYLGADPEDVNSKDGFSVMPEMCILWDVRLDSWEQDVVWGKAIDIARQQEVEAK